jgi:3-isopropylmalate dehydratase small subunit
VLPEDVCAALRVAARGGADITVDLPNQQVRAANSVHSFEIDAFRKQCLLDGLDDIGLTLANDDSISTFEASDRQRRPWAQPHS